MKHYYINTKTDSNPNNNNEVHTEDCKYIPDASNRDYIGYFNNGNEAVKSAKDKGYSDADGCFHCCPESHQE